jgi:hypothetical protein
VLHARSLPVIAVDFYAVEELVKEHSPFIVRCGLPDGRYVDFAR